MHKMNFQTFALTAKYQPYKPQPLGTFPLLQLWKEWLFTAMDPKLDNTSP